MSFSNASNIWSSTGTLEPRLNDAFNDGARVHSNSWGDDGTTAYTTWCRQIDVHTWNNQDSVVAFAVSNQSTLKTPENSINVLAVGATNDTPNQANRCYGGVGPTADGRRKPEVYAPGCDTVSASNSACGTTSLSGTSMACPAVSAGGLLVRQYFTEGFHPSGAANPADAFTPTGALIRATLLNGTVDMTGVTGYPSNAEGWGRLLLDNALYFPADTTRKLWLRDVRHASGGLTTGQVAEYQFQCNGSQTPLKVTMVFTAPPAAVNASNPVINNLDLEVVAPSGATYLGNVFTSGQSSTGGTADLRNNVGAGAHQHADLGHVDRSRARHGREPGAAGLCHRGFGQHRRGMHRRSDRLAPAERDRRRGAERDFLCGRERCRPAVPVAPQRHVAEQQLANQRRAIVDALHRPRTGGRCGQLRRAGDQLLHERAERCCRVDRQHSQPLPPDIDGTPGLSVSDIFTFLSLWFANDPQADWDGANGVDVADIFAYLSDWFAGC